MPSRNTNEERKHLTSDRAGAKPAQPKRNLFSKLRSANKKQPSPSQESPIDETGQNLFAPTDAAKDGADGDADGLFAPSASKQVKKNKGRGTQMQRGTSVDASFSASNQLKAGNKDFLREALDDRVSVYSNGV